MSARKGRRVALWAAGLVIAVVAVLFAIPFLLGHDAFRMNGSLVELDLETGRIRSTRLLLFVRVRQTVMDTAVTRALPPAALGRLPAWRIVSSFVVGMHISPHYYFHDAVSAVRVLEQAFDTGSFSPGAKCRIAETIVKAWKEEEGHFEADRFMDAVCLRASDLEREGERQIEVADVEEAWRQIRKDVGESSSR